MSAAHAPVSSSTAVKDAFPATDAEAFTQHLATLRRQVEAAMDASLADRPDIVANVPPSLRESMRYSALGGGKRLRPVLVLLACEACGTPVAQSMPAAVALEMIHCYSLIHDDLPAMDDDDLRRGRPTNHIVYGEATAILAGDGLLTRAFEVLATEIPSKDVALACVADLASAAGWCGMVGGQAADLAAETTPITTLAELEQIHHRKTGRLLACALTMGGRIGGASALQLAALSRYGFAIGLAFQIADDLLDVEGTSEKLGKQTQKDAGAGKATYPGFLGVEASRQRAADLVAQACGELELFGPQGEWLAHLSRFIIERDH
ncbi:MAG: farnesyl-diphosphate synthase [Planctomyces sp.]|nr:farnesyl-diphosphate synthase [Planctomyces sp.]